VKQADSADDGTIVLAMIEGEVTVKRIFKGKESVVLRSDNPAMPPIQVRRGNKISASWGKWSSGVSETVKPFPTGNTLWQSCNQK